MKFVGVIDIVNISLEKQITNIQKQPMTKIN
jgi:hypothetical protein